ncbi:Helix-turn-helix domain protein [Streptomyces sp. S4.7]|uniref:helix-turn-helix transcriptional regulator n=1 Tax=Streptomyces sp. S4.7 TaxID=2705439 RepID=UPI001398DA80|nr:helix-turn-helix domain-containing protein [Streptomyces sp. S4.7]QHY98857.1 Helix-turn-helix domain protein [Streptomyces sp. S4.7]
MPGRSLLAATASSGVISAAFLTVKDAADYLGLSPHTLYVWRHRRQGPPSFRMGPRGRVMYRLEALDAWVREQEQADSRSNPALNPLNTPPQERSSRFLGDWKPKRRGALLPSPSPRSSTWPAT